MKAVRRKGWFVALARRYVRAKLARSFAGVHVADLDKAAALAQTQPVIVAANHVAWWDALLAVLVDELLGAESYCLMDAHNLQRLPFFGWVGAIPIDTSSPRAALSSLREAMALCDRPGRLLWVFPQGRQRPAHLRPLELRRGVELLAAKTGAPVLPLALRYDFLEGPKPEVNISFGRPLVADQPPGDSLLEQLERRLVEELERIDRHLLAPDPAFVPQLGRRGRTALPVGGKVLALVGRKRRIHD